MPTAADAVEQAKKKAPTTPKTKSNIPMPVDPPPLLAFKRKNDQSN